MEPALRLSRRRLLAALGLAVPTVAMTAVGCAATGSAPAASTGGITGPGPHHIAYGADDSQWGELSLPTGPALPGVVVILHGGFWMAEYGAELGSPLAADLASRGYAVWNLEYRRVGNGGGWPQTFQDVAAGIDHLRTIAPSAGLSLTKVVALGHSAGGQLAAWAAGRKDAGVADPHAATRVALTGVVSQAGVVDLDSAAEQQLGGGATQQFLGGDPAAVPDRYAVASPLRNLPCPVPIRCVHGTEDGNVPMSQSQGYVAAAGVAGGNATLTTVPGDHFALITTGTAAWDACIARTAELLRG